MKSCTGTYQGNSNIKRQLISADKTSWDIELTNYFPQEHTDKKVLAGPEWADPDISGLHDDAKPLKKGELKFNHHDGKVNRRSHIGRYEIKNGLPMYLK